MDEALTFLKKKLVKRQETFEDDKLNSVSNVKSFENKIENLFLENLKTFVETTIELGVNGILNEYRNIQKESAKRVYPHSEFLKNMSMNRYKDIVCFDHSRVILKKEDCLEEANDYINANYMNLDKNKAKYIACQSPLSVTIYDFWRMIWQENVQVIVMLCKIVENGKKKCEEYFPTTENRILNIGSFTLICQKQCEIEKGLRRTDIEIVYKNELRNVTHFHWYTWPDKSVPDSSLMCLRVMNKAMAFKLPVVVHCSAGVGRTGTIVAIDNLLDKLHKEPTSLKSVVLELRDCRHKFVQVEIQYLYIHRVLLSYALQKDIINGESAVQWLNEYKNAVNRLTETELSFYKKKGDLKSRFHEKNPAMLSIYNKKR